MGGWETVFVARVAVNVEAVDTVHAFQFFEAVQRNLTGTCDKLQQFGKFFFIKGSDCSPEPLDLRRRLGVAMILGIASPIIHIDVGKTRDEELEFLLIENGDNL